MKKTLMILILIVGFSISGLILMAQDPPPPPNEGHGMGTNQPLGGGAPLYDSIGILLFLSLAYSGFKIYHARKKSLEMPTY